MLSYLTRSFPSLLKRNLSLYLLTLSGVALGVGSVVAIQLINQNSIEAFQSGVELVTGQTDITVEGVAPTFQEEALAEVLSVEGVRSARPLLEAKVALDEGGPLLDLIGIDLTQPDSGASAESLDLSRALGVPGWTLVSRPLARKRNWSQGDTFSASYGTRNFELVVGRILESNEHSSQSTLLLQDISQVQHHLGEIGQLSRIQILIEEEEDLFSVQSRLRQALGSSLQILTPGEQKERARGLLEAFRLNLTALSLISLFVGVFLVYSSTQASLIRRRREFGLLRSLGATPFQVLSLILLEVGIVGGVGVMLGLPLGYWAARFQLETVNSTLTNIYLLSRIEDLHFPGWLLILAVGLGLTSALLAALIPALEITRRDPKALLAAFNLRYRVVRSARPLFLLGLILLVSALLFCTLAGLDWKPSGFILGVAVLLFLPLASPLATSLLGRSVTVRDFGLRYSLRSLADRVQTSAFSVASLAVAVSMLIGITLMIGSFRETVSVWVDTTIVADLYVTSESWRGAATRATLEGAGLEEIQEIPGVAGVDRIRTLPFYLEDQRILLSGVDITTPRSERRYPLLRGDGEMAYSALAAGEGVLISEPLARKSELTIGEMVHLSHDAGVLQIPVSGIIYDYTTEWGLVVMDFELLSRTFLDSSAPNSLAVYLQPDAVPVEEFSERLKQRFAQIPLEMTSSSDLRQSVLEIFDQTFAVVRILQLMSLLIAACGITLALLILAREQVSELALYRALGAFRSQIFRVFLGKGLGIALLSLLLGLLGGLGLALILIFVINRAYFGWTIQLSIPWSSLSFEIILILGAAFLASLYPALRASRTPASELTRDDL